MPRVKRRPGSSQDRRRLPSGAAGRRLLILVGASVFLDAMFFGALTPLIPRYADEFSLSKASAGLLVAALGAGAVAGGIAGGFATTRIGSKRTTVLGLALLSAASLAFALASGPWALGLARLAQGGASATTWAGGLAWLTNSAPVERRGEVIGTAFGMAVFGAIVGPMFGAVAVAIGVRNAFAAVSACALVLAVWAGTVPAPPVERYATGMLRHAFRDARFLGALWLNTLVAVLFGLLALLAPLALSNGGFGAWAIGLTFFSAGLFEVALNPVVGRISDRVGRRGPTRFALGASALVAALLGLVSTPAAIVALVWGTSIAFGALNTPGMALVSDRARAVGLAQGLAYGVMTSAWGIGNLCGPAIGGLLADHFGDAVPYFAASGICLLTLLASYRVTRSRAVPRAVP